MYFDDRRALPKAVIDQIGRPDRAGSPCFCEDLEHEKVTILL
jgi:hypothetical protein